MASFSRPSSLIFSLYIFVLISSLASLTLAQVSAKNTFRFVNQGELGERISEFDATYRLIRVDNGVDLDTFFFNRPFRFCFYNTTPDAFVLGIRVGIANDETLMRWFWAANRNHPVRENSTLSFARDGNLVLADVDGRVAWQTNTAGKGVTGIRMLPNGNLVLFDKKGKFVWQSFDHPSDTLFAGTSLPLNGYRLVSRTSDVDGSEGPYSLAYDNKGLSMYVNNSGELLLYGGWQGSSFGPIVTFVVEPENEEATAYELVWAINQELTPPSPPSRRRLLQSRPIASGSRLNLWKLNYNATYSFLRLDSDGNLKVYTYYDKSSYLNWEESYSFYGESVRECGMPSKCSKFGLCDKKMCVACPSPKGLLGWSEGCAPPKLPPCKGGAKAVAVDYYKIVGVEHFLNPYNDDGVGPVKVGECRQKCDEDCKCVGFVYKEDILKCLTLPLLGTFIKDVNATSVAFIKYTR